MNRAKVIAALQGLRGHNVRSIAKGLPKAVAAAPSIPADNSSAAAPHGDDGMRVDLDDEENALDYN
jgi:hypothetical protein